MRKFVQAFFTYIAEQKGLGNKYTEYLHFLMNQFFHLLWFNTTFLEIFRTLIQLYLKSSLPLQVLDYRDFFLERGSQLGISFFPFLHVFDLKALSFWKPTLKCYCIAASTNSMLLLRRCFLLSTLTENMNDDLTTTGWWWNQFFYFFFFCW